MALSAERAGMSQAIEITPTDDRIDPKRLAAPTTLAHGRVDWPYAISFAFYHLVALLAFWPWLFSWTGLGLALAGTYVFGTLGINLCYHRLLTHRSFDCPKWLEHALAILGVCCLQDTPARWVGVHRLHHQHSDEPPDPHSPLVTFLWGHVGWLLIPNHELSRMQLYERYAKDLLRERFYMNLERRFLWVWINLLQWVVFFVAGLVIGLIATGAAWAASVQFALSVLVWGVFVRTVLVWHITWSINSVTHLWGYRNYDTDENSRNNLLIGYISNGEGWHNNHHAQPRAAAHGHKWWEFDVTYLTIQALQLAGLASKIVPFRTLPPGRLVTNNQPVE
jgi:stearoyl-CoA desaturase (delta-9 desaturase)